MKNKYERLINESRFSLSTSEQSRSSFHGVLGSKFSENRSVRARLIARRDEGQALIAVIMLLLIMFIMAFGLMTSTINLSNTNQGDVYLHSAQSASQAGQAYFSQIMSADGSGFMNCGNPGEPACVSTSMEFKITLGGSNSQGKEVAFLTISFPGCTYTSGASKLPCTNMSQCTQYASTSNGCTYIITSVGCLIPFSASVNSASFPGSCIGSVTSTTQQSYFITNPSFLNNALWVNHSADDPADAVSYGTELSNGTFVENTTQEKAALNHCGKYLYQGGLNNSQWTINGTTYSCTYTYEDYGDTFYGPVYSSDQMFNCELTFYGGPVKTGVPSATSPWIWYSSAPNGSCPPGAHKPYLYVSPTNNTTFNFTHVPLETTPQNLTNLQTNAETGGCLFTGPTVVALLPKGKMAVYSPDTTSFQSNGSYPFYSTPYNSGSGNTYPCGVPAGATSGNSYGDQCNASIGGLAAPINPNTGIPGCIINDPNAGLTNGNGINGTGAVYVQNVTGTEATQMKNSGLGNYYCPNVEGEVMSPSEVQQCQLRGDLMVQGGSGYNVPSPYNTNCQTMISQGTPNSCFDAFATFGSDANVILSGSLTYADSGGLANYSSNQYAYWDAANPSLSDSLGLVATNFMEINLPADPGYFDYGIGNGQACSYYWYGCTYVAHQNYTIDAAIMATNNSFGVTNLDYTNSSSPGSDGPGLGTMTVQGSIISDWTLNNGVIGNNGVVSGYYPYTTYYDTAFLTSANWPPNFPTPVVSSTQYLEG